MNDLPYRTFNAHLRERFGCRVHRIGLDAAFTCPNIDGAKGRGGCHFCDISGSLAGYQQPELSISQQIKTGIERLSKRTKAEKYLAYFQSFTATYEKPERLRALFEEALGCDPRIVGLAVGARADCLEEPMLDLLEEFHRRTYLWLDIGLESANDETLRRVNRHTTTAEFVDSMHRAKSRGILVCAHVIFGLPGDSEADMMRSIDMVNDLGLDGIKIHNLYIDRRSQFGAMHQRDRIEIMSREKYIDLVCRALMRLRPEILIHRLTGEAPREHHLAPDWVLDKSRLLLDIQQEMRRRRVAKS